MRKSTPATAGWQSGAAQAGPVQVGWGWGGSLWGMRAGGAAPVLEGCDPSVLSSPARRKRALNGLLTAG